MAVRIGMLTPSSNTALEPATGRVAAAFEGVSAHFSRFRVTQIWLDFSALGQFDSRPMLAAADLSADAKCDVICWNGTSASWLGLEGDCALVREIQARAGCRASICVLSLVKAFRALGVRKYGLVTPYLSDVQARIIDNFSKLGFACASE